MSCNLVKQRLELIEQFSNFSLFIFALIFKPDLIVVFLEYLVIVYDLLNLVLLYFYGLEWESSEAQLSDEQLHSFLDKLAVFRKESLQPVLIFLILQHKLFNGIDSFFEDESFLCDHELAML